MLAQLNSKIPALSIIKYSRAIATFVITLIICSCSDNKNGPQITGMTMGTTYSVHWTKLPDTITLAQLQAKINTRLEEINDLMSTYKPHSQLSGFNRSRETGWHAVELEIAELVNLALNVSGESNGAFDITVGPLVNLWGFGPSETAFSPPTQTEINIAKRSVGYKFLESRLQPPALNKKLVDLYIDLSAIAKGYAVDQISTILQTENIKNFMIEIGGEVKGQGVAAHGKPWRIGIETPQTQRGNIEAVISLEDVGVATSGNYRNFIEHEGKTYSHTIDPRTGYPVTHSLSSVTVVHDSVTIADAWATAFLVLGADQAYKIAQRENMATLLITREESTFKVTASDAMKKYLTE